MYIRFGVHGDQVRARRLRLTIFAFIQFLVLHKLFRWDASDTEALERRLTLVSRRIHSHIHCLRATVYWAYSTTKYTYIKLASPTVHLLPVPEVKNSTKLQTVQFRARVPYWYKTDLSLKLDQAIYPTSSYPRLRLR